jgi:hypothetical protein
MLMLEKHLLLVLERARFELLCVPTSTLAFCSLGVQHYIFVSFPRTVQMCAVV